MTTKTDEEAALKPCPFCGGQALMFENKSNTIKFVECGNKNCGMRPKTNHYVNREIAIEVWNTRHKDTQLREKLVEAIRLAIEKTEDLGNAGTYESLCLSDEQKDEVVEAVLKEMEG